MIEVISVNVGAARMLAGRSFNGQTGIFKEPVPGSTAVTELGLEGDAVLDSKHHGGPDQALYLYRQEDYDWWSTEQASDDGGRFEPGTFGENLTVRGLPAVSLRIGSRLTSASLILEVTAPRIPCNTLAQRMNDARFAKQFIQAERPGIYLRVLQAGNVQPGDTFELTGNDSEGPSTLEMFRAAYRKLNRDELNRFLAAPIDIRSRRDYEAQLKKLDAG